MPSSLPPPDWYDDPEGKGSQRWWDGAGWTDHRRPASGAAAPGKTEAPAAWSAQTADALPAGVELANPGLRLAAFILDVVLIWLGVFIVSLPFLLLDSVAPGSVLATILSIPAFVVLVGLAFVYPWFAEGRIGQTYGKHVLNIEIVSIHTGGHIGAGTAFGRTLVRSLGAYALGLGLLWMLWDPRRQGWHDKASNSVVILRPDGERDDPLTHLRRVLGQV